MNDFKVGDKVRIIAAEDTERYKNGDILTVSDLSYGEEARHVMVTCADGQQELAYLREIEPLTPDVITINRADLPEVSAEYEASDFPGKDTPRIALAVLLADGWGSADDAVASLRSVIAGYEKSIAYDIANDKRSNRRDELAKEVAKAGCYVAWPTYTYKDHDAATKAAIDMIMKLEASHD